MTVRDIVCLVLYLSLFTGALHAEALHESDRTALLSEEITLDFKPTHAFFFVQREVNELERMPGFIVPAAAQGTNAVESRSRRTTWLIGALATLSPTVQHLSYSVLVAGGGGNVHFVPPRQLELTQDSLNVASTDILRERILQRKSVLRSWEVQIRAQDESLSRLRADADIIANLTRIVDARDEIDSLAQETRDLEKDKDNLKKFLSYAKARSSAKNVIGRQSQLTKQIAELAEAAKTAELGEIKRRSDSEMEIQATLQLIEETRNDDLDALQRELVKVRKERLELQKQR